MGLGGCCYGFCSRKSAGEAAARLYDSRNQIAKSKQHAVQVVFNSFAYALQFSSFWLAYVGLLERDLFFSKQRIHVKSMVFRKKKKHCKSCFPPEAHPSERLRPPDNRAVFFG